MKKIQFLVIHCTDTPAGREVSSDEIRRWHTLPPPKGRGWKQVGYTRMYHLNGSCDVLVKNNNDSIVDSWEITNGVAGKNSISQHWVYVGGKGCDTRTQAQKDAMASDIIAFHQKFPGVKIVGHNYFDKGKACPSFDVINWLKSINIIQTL